MVQIYDGTNLGTCEPTIPQRSQLGFISTFASFAMYKPCGAAMFRSFVCFAVFALSHLNVFFFKLLKTFFINFLSVYIQGKPA